MYVHWEGASGITFPGTEGFIESTDNPVIFNNPVNTKGLVVFINIKYLIFKKIKCIIITFISLQFL